MKKALLFFGLFIYSIANAQLKIVFQLTSSDTLVHKAIIRQLNNILKEDSSIKLAVICHGPGIEMLLKTKTKVNLSVQELSQKGVEFVACENTMLEKKISQNELISGISYVKAGIIEIAKRQKDDWSYIKAGF